MARKATLVVALALLLTCGPTAVTTPSVSPSPSLTPIATTDLITLREGGQQPSLSVRKVANGELVTSTPDGLLLPDGQTLLVVERGVTQTTIKKMTRLKGATIVSMQIPGSWELMRGYPWMTGGSPDGSHVVLFGSAYNVTDQNGTWTAKTTFAVVDLASWHVDTIDLPGHYQYEALSNDGKLVYVGEYTPTDARTRVYDTTTRELRDVAGGALLSSTTYAGGLAFGMVSVREQVTVRPDVIQVTTVNKLARLDLGTGAVTLLPLPVGQSSSGEDSLAWSFLATRDARMLYAVNPLVGIISQIDLASFRVIRTAPLVETKSLLDRAIAAVHPVALGKMEFLQGAAFSADESKIYALALEGLWSIDVASLQATRLAKGGAYQSLKVSPDGTRLYVIGRENGTVSAIDARSGAVIGAMKQLARPTDIVAVDAG